MITGDLNAGKSTLINALTGQSILPTDQQPCTQAFCEIILSEDDCDQGGKVIGYTDSVEEPLTMDQLKHELQSESCQYNWFKIYIPAPSNDPTTTLTLIDSPGLNTDQIKTTGLLTQQQEIDVIVFVINAAFHLTLSGREFLQQAAKDRQKIFFVVNKYDEIVNSQRCRTQILKQIQEVMPEMSTEDSDSLIHFISAKQVLEGYNKEVEEEDSSNLLGKDEQIESTEIVLNRDECTFKSKEQFKKMKDALMDFVLQKRSISKLSPAKTYSTRLLQDLLELSAFNIRRLTADSHGLMSRLEALAPELQEKEHQLPQLRSDLNSICETSASAVRESCSAESVALRNEFIKLISNQPFGNILNSRGFVQAIFTQGRQEYATFAQRITSLTRNACNNAVEQIQTIAHKHTISFPNESQFDFNFPSRLPLSQPPLLDLIDPHALLHHFGLLNLASLASGLLAYQPLLNVCLQLANRLGISPWLIGGLFCGGLGVYLGHLAASSVEASLRSRLLSLFSGVLNDELVGESCRQSVFVYLHARSSTLLTTHLSLLEQSRHQESLLRSKHECLADEILFLKDLSRRIESLLQQSHLINLS